MYVTASQPVHEGTTHTRRCYVSGRGELEGKNKARGFLTVSLSAAEPTLARPARRGTGDEGRAEGEL
jgi:hypothetical protein